MASNRRSLVLFLLLTLIRIQHGQELTLSQVESRRLSRHARDEIDWAEGNNKHRKRTQSKYDETQARNELHRMEELTRKKLPTLEASATRVGNSKKDRAKLEKNQKLMGEIEHALLVEQRGERLKKLHKNEKGKPVTLTSYFPNIELDEEATNYVNKRASRDTQPTHKDENKLEAWKRKQAHMNLLDKKRGGVEFDETSFTPLDKHAKPFKRQRRADHIARVANAQLQATNTPHAMELRRQEDAHNRQIERLERAQTLEVDLESRTNLGIISRSHLEWVNRLPKVSRLAWGLPLIVLHVLVNGDDVLDAISISTAMDADSVEDEAWSLKRKTLQIWSKAEECLSRLLDSLAQAEYLNDMVDLHIHLKLPEKVISHDSSSEETSTSGNFFKNEDLNEFDSDIGVDKIVPEAVGIFEVARDFTWSHGRKNVTLWDKMSPSSSSTQMDSLEYLAQWSPVDGVNELGVFLDGLRDEMSAQYYTWLKASTLYLNYDEYQEDSIKFVDKPDYFSAHGARVVGFSFNGNPMNKTIESTATYQLRQAISEQGPFGSGSSAFAMWGDAWWELRGYAIMRQSVRLHARVQLSPAHSLDSLDSLDSHVISWQTLIAEFATAHSYFLLHASFHHSSLSLHHQFMNDNVVLHSKVSVNPLPPVSLHVKWPGRDILKNHMPLFPDLIAISRFDCFGYQFYEWDNKTKTNKYESQLETSTSRALVKWVKVEEDVNNMEVLNISSINIHGCLDTFTKAKVPPHSPKLDLFRSTSACLRRNLRKTT